MSIDYAEVKKVHRAGKANVTRARNKGDLHKVIQVCDDTLAAFEDIGFPDDWAHFQRAKDDALLELRFRSF